MRHRNTIAAAAALGALASIAGLHPRPAHAMPVIEAPVNRLIQWPHDSLPLSRVAVLDAYVAILLDLAASGDQTAAARVEPRPVRATIVPGDCPRRSPLRVTAC
jgi:hypothetical protein